jgi:hypothetical protein
LKKYEYKTVTVKQKMNLIKPTEYKDFEKVLNEEGMQGWKVRQVIYPTLERIIVIFEREII